MIRFTEKQLPRTAVVAIKYAGKILIVRRGSTAPWMPNKWSLVGGVVDEGESPSKAAIRETFEEVGINLSSVKEINRWIMGGWEYFVYSAEVKSDKVKLDLTENSAYEWISIEDIDKYKFVPGAKEILKAIL